MPNSFLQVGWPMDTKYNEHILRITSSLVCCWCVISIFVVYSASSFVTVKIYICVTI